MPYPKSERVCETCSYFKPADGAGWCRVDRPSVFMDDEDSYTVFPTVQPDEFCGQGKWTRHSDITGDDEEYSFDTPENSWDEMCEIRRNRVKVWLTKFGEPTNVESIAVICLAVKPDANRVMLDEAIKTLLEKLDAASESTQ